MAQNIIPEYNRNRILEWLNEDGIPIRERQLNEQQIRNVVFLLESMQPPFPTISIYSTILHPDRIIIHGGVNLAPNHAQIFNNDWEPDRRNIFLLDLQNRLTMLDVRFQLVHRDNQFIGVTINLSIMNDELTKGRLSYSYVRIQEIINIIRNIMSVNLGTGIQQQPPNDHTPVLFGNLTSLHQIILFVMF